MASKQQHQEAGYKADDEMSSGGNAQISKQNATITSQATNFLQQTGEQVKSMAQGAAEAVKSTLGMTTDNSASPNPSAGSAGNNPGSGPTASAGNNPGSGPTASAGNNPGSGPTASAGNHPGSGPTASAGNHPGSGPTASAENHPGGAAFGPGGNNPRDVSVASGGNLISPTQTASAGSHRSNPSQARS